MLGANVLLKYCSGAKCCNVHFRKYARNGTISIGLSSKFSLTPCLYGLSLLLRYVKTYIYQASLDMSFEHISFLSFSMFFFFVTVKESSDKLLLKVF